MSTASGTTPGTGFLQYHEPDIVNILILLSFFFFLSSLGWVFNKLIRASLIGQILLGVLYGTPVGNILDVEWQTTFMALGYIGLILIIFEGGLTIRMDLLRANFFLSLIAAAIGIVTPIALCYLLLYLGFHYGALETFIIGAALSTTSIGTTFVVISSSAEIDFTHTKVGTVLLSAALFDDVVGLIMLSVISNLGQVGEGGGNIGWIIGRPVLASLAIGIISPLLASYAAGPLYRRWVEHPMAGLGHRTTVTEMVFVLAAHIVISSYIGTSLLFGAFLAGMFLSALPSPQAATERSRSSGEDHTPNFHSTYERYLSGPQTYILEPLFFSSIGFAVPFKQLWTGTVIWRGIVFSLLMGIGKAVVGLSVPLWDVLSQRTRPKGKCDRRRMAIKSHWTSATLLGMAMVARGEIGLLIIQLGLNDTSFLTEEAFLVAIWAIVLDTIIGPVSVGLLLRKFDKAIAEDPRWGIQMAGEGKSSTSDMTPPPPVTAPMTKPNK